MVEFIARLLGFKVVYVCDWCEYESRYDALDRHMMRPIHRDMSTAPPWAKMKFVRKAG